MAENYRLKIGHGDTIFEAEGDKKFVLDMWEKFQKDTVGKKPSITEEKSQKKLSASVDITSSATKNLSVGEFIKQLSFKKHTDLVLAFGYYLEKFSGIREFGPADINKCYYDAKMDSSNTSQMLIQNIKRGRIMEAKGKKRLYTLTNTGEGIIEKALSKKETTK